jgi:parallel beta-helix repeat protein
MFTPRGLVAAAAIALCAATSSAQLSGAYSIDNSFPTGGGNYASFAAAAADLVAQGVAGPVFFFVGSGSGPYGGFSIAGPITGASATNFIIFEAAPGNTPVLSGPPAGQVQTVRLGSAVTLNSGPKFITLSGLTVTGAPSGAGIMAVGCSDLVIQNCTVSGCGTGIYLGGTHHSVVQGCDVSTCGNTPGTPGSATYVGGITLYNQSNDCTVQRNKVHDCSGNGIFAGGSGGTNSVVNDVIINNMVWNTPGLGTYPGGIALRRVSGSIVANNSVSMPAGSTLAGLYISAAVATGVTSAAEVSNNVIRHAGSGPCVKFDVTTAAVPVIFDYNIYEVAGSGPLGQVATTNYATLAAWQGLAAPSLAGQELNSYDVPVGFVSATDLHISPGSPAFNSGSAVAVVTEDIDGDPRPIGPPDRGADETPAAGIYASFTATNRVGPAPLMVSFSDSSFTSDPGGVFAWAWDFENDGIVDSNVQNPSFTYLVPGTYSVSLTATDILHGSNTFTRVAYITVGPYIFVAQTTGGGVGDLQIQPVPTYGVPNAAVGFMFVTFDTALPVGAGPFFGITPDSITWSIILSPPTVGGLVAWVSTPGLFPDVPFGVGPGALAIFAGLSCDFVQVDLTSTLTIANISNVARVTF